MTAQVDNFDELEARLKTLLPEPYRDRYDEVQPVSMGSAGLKFSPDGKVAWDEIWGSFCDLAMAGGPPHKGALLVPGSEAEIAAQPDLYKEVVTELCRGITLVTGLHAEPASAGWVRIYCTSAGMAGWLARAIVMENVSARFKGLTLELPAGPAYRLEKEIKNVITVIAKTCHYWLGHTSDEQRDQISALFRAMERESPLIQPVASATNQTLAQQIAVSIQAATGLQSEGGSTAGWLGVDCREVRAAVWMMRMLAVLNVLTRREGSLAFVPIDPVGDPTGQRVVRQFVQAHRMAMARDVFPS